jgi:hypothetical protein
VTGPDDDGDDDDDDCGVGGGGGSCNYVGGQCSALKISQPHTLFLRALKVWLLLTTWKLLLHLFYERNSK